MLFLFNDVVFDLGDPRDTALQAGLPHGFSETKLLSMRIGRVIKLVREAMYDEHYLPRTNPEIAGFLAAMIAWKTDEANALLAVAPKHATTASRIGVAGGDEPARRAAARRQAVQPCRESVGLA